MGARFWPQIAYHLPSTPLDSLWHDQLVPSLLLNTNPRRRLACSSEPSAIVISNSQAHHVTVAPTHPPPLLPVVTYAMPFRCDFQIRILLDAIEAISLPPSQFEPHAALPRAMKLLS